MGLGMLDTLFSILAFKSEKSALGDKKAEVNKEITGLEKSQVIIIREM